MMPQSVQDIERPWTFNAPRSSATSRSRSISKLDLHFVFYYYYSDHHPDTPVFLSGVGDLKWRQRTFFSSSSCLTHWHIFFVFLNSPAPSPRHFLLVYTFPCSTSTCFSQSAGQCRRSVWFVDAAAENGIHSLPFNPFTVAAVWMTVVA